MLMANEADKTNPKPDHSYFGLHKKSAAQYKYLIIAMYMLVNYLVFNKHNIYSQTFFLYLRRGHNC